MSRPLSHRIYTEVLSKWPKQELRPDYQLQDYKLSGQMLKPTSQPTYFDDLIREIEEAPKRTWFERLGKRLSGMIRLS
uniref:Uncharacterized protein n=1 Tax=Bionectria ochroleuca TaxID=29856 RepID=A0A0B7K6G5_BIOOC